jgi:WD40 repeat protein
MNLASKLFLTLTCLAGSQLVYCSQAQTTPMAVDQGSPAIFAEQKQAVAQAVLQATARTAAPTTGQEIVERDPKRIKRSLDESAKPKNWLLHYTKKISSEEKKKLEESKIEYINNNRATVLPDILYDLLACMPSELTNLIASYDKSYELLPKLDRTFKITLPHQVTITAITPLLQPYGNTVIVGLSNGSIQIFKEVVSQRARENWKQDQNLQVEKLSYNSIQIIDLKDQKFAGEYWTHEQTLQVQNEPITAIVDLKDQTFATCSEEGELKIWGLATKQKYELKRIIATGIDVEKFAALPNGNIVVIGVNPNYVPKKRNIWDDNEEENGLCAIWSPTSGQCVYKLEEWLTITNLSVSPGGTVVIIGCRPGDSLTIDGIYVFNFTAKQPSEYNAEEPNFYVPAGIDALCVLPNNDIAALVHDVDKVYKQVLLWKAKDHDNSSVLRSTQHPICLLACTSNDDVPDNLIALRDGRLIYNTQLDPGAGTTWIIENEGQEDCHGRKDRELSFEGTPRHIIELYDGRLLAVLTDNRRFNCGSKVEYEDDSIEIYG